VIVKPLKVPSSTNYQVPDTLRIGRDRACPVLILCSEQGFSQVNVFLYSVRLLRTRLGMWKILARRRRAKIFHIPKKKARLRAESGNATIFEKPSLRMKGLDISNSYL